MYYSHIFISDIWLKIEQGAVRRRNEYNIDILRYLGIRDIIQVQHKMNISIVFRWIMPGRGVRRTRHSPTKVSNGITTVQTCFTIILFLTACQLGKFFSICERIDSIIYIQKHENEINFPSHARIHKLLFSDADTEITHIHRVWLTLLQYYCAIIIILGLIPSNYANVIWKGPWWLLTKFKHNSICSNMHHHITGL